jgi:hypothetical protein
MRIAVGSQGIGAGGPAGPFLGASLDNVNFLRTRALRRAIHAREGGLCFSCLRRIPSRARSLDHVVPRVDAGRNSYRSLVSRCLECNSRKRQRSAGDFLRWLYRKGGLTKDELFGRLRALHALAAGKLRPRVYNQGETASENR